MIVQVKIIGEKVNTMMNKKDFNQVSILTSIIFLIIVITYLLSIFNLEDFFYKSM